MNLFPASLKESIYNEFVLGVSNHYGISPLTVMAILSVIMIWSIFWKFFGLWKSARNNSPIWFVIIALTNTLGIIPILYIYLFSKINYDSGSKVKRRKSKN